MSDAILRGVSADIKSAREKVKDAEELIEAMKEAGEDASELERNLRDLKLRMVKWERMLEARGIK